MFVPKPEAVFVWAPATMLKANSSRKSIHGDQRHDENFQDLRVVTTDARARSGGASLSRRTGITNRGVEIGCLGIMLAVSLEMER
jgi:hypothetical protein